MAGLAIVFAALGNPFAPTRTQVDILEVNHVHDEWGFPKFVQLIAWDWLPEHKCYRVRAWKLLDDAYADGGKDHRTAFDAEVERLANTIGSWKLQAEFLRAAKYRGVFVGGKHYPRLIRGEYVTRLTTKDGESREVVAKRRIETHTQYDREYADREFWPESHRAGW